VLARRSTLPILLAALALAGACRGRAEQGPAPAESATAAPSGATETAAPRTALSAFALEAADAASRDARALHASIEAGAADAGAPAYLALRRSVARAAPFVRARVHMAAEVLFGPQRPAEEAAGAIAALDAALARHDPAAAGRALGQIEPALVLAVEEIGRSGVPATLGATAISDAAYDLGVALLEASPDLPADPAAILAQQRGTLAAVEGGAAALTRDLAAPAAEAGAVTAAAAPLQAALDRARTSLDLDDRAALAIATGRLGAAVRQLATGRGVRVRLPYPARFPVADQGPAEPVSVLTLPAPRRSAERADEQKRLAEVGRRLFSDTRLSRGRARSCASCHEPARWFTDGRAAPASLVPGGASLRHTPTLLYTSIHAAQMWDGSILTPQDQALHVIHRREEMGLDDADLAAALAAAPEYRAALAGPSGAPSPATAARALAAFEALSLVPGDAPIDRLARGDETALGADARRGLDVFAGKGRCARCHVPPLFGGSRPRDFSVPVFAVLGVPDAPGSHALDPDRGRALVTHRAADEHAFKTPTLRDIGKTAPYFHHGRYARLEDVVDFYDEGGGRALGLDVPNQDPEVRPLGLTAEEKRVLLVFLREALLDASPPDRAMAPR
jgi:cytochrome c peroxidase